jgi:hypothetical protein
MREYDGDGEGEGEGEEDDALELHEIDELKQTLAQHTMQIEVLSHTIRMKQQKTQQSSTDSESESESETETETETETEAEAEQATAKTGDDDVGGDIEDIETMLLNQERTMRESNIHLIQQAAQKAVQSASENASENASQHASDRHSKVSTRLTLLKKGTSKSNLNVRKPNLSASDIDIDPSPTPTPTPTPTQINADSMAIETDESSESSDEMPIGRLADRIEFIKNKCIAGMSLEGFQVAYTLMKKLQFTHDRTDMNDAINNKIKQLCNDRNVSQSRVRKYRSLIDQLLFIEVNCS